MHKSGTKVEGHNRDLGGHWGCAHRRSRGKAPALGTNGQPPEADDILLIWPQIFAFMSNFKLKYAEILLELMKYRCC